MPSERNKAVFLDRDGVINREQSRYVTHLEDFIINDGVVEALKIFRDKNYLLIVISNQGGISKGLCTKEEVDYLHLHLQRVMSNKGIEISEVYYCPHHPDVTNCICRKPDSQMLEKAMARFNINPLQSYFIGDAERDIEAGKKAGVKTIKVEANQSLMEVVGWVE
ncbi:MAG: HAD family hydrolase [Bacteroidetes bacterium]|nr:HAD family hydrolase [Bacteroidota bacterium]